MFGGGAEHWASVIRACPVGGTVITCANRKELAEHYANIQCLVGWQFPDTLFDRLPNLEWIQNLSVGVDTLLKNPRIEPGVRISNTQGIYGDAIAEYVVWAMLTLFRQFHLMIQNQGKRQWQQVFGPALGGQTVGIVGLGDVGLQVAKRAAAFDMKTIGFVRDEKLSMPCDFVDGLLPIRELDDHVAEIDALVLCIPLTESTAGIISQRTVSRMNKDSILINISRSGLIEGSAVANAVASGKIAGAALDVFDKEPIRRWSPLWKTKNLLVTPHTSAMTSDYKKRVADLIGENMVRFADGRPLRNEIDRARGY